MTDTSAWFINVIDVDPDQQQDLLTVMADAAEQVIRPRPGFQSLTLLASLDGRRVINIVGWASEDDARSTQSDPRASEFAARVAEMARPIAGNYQLVREIR